MALTIREKVQLILDKSHTDYTARDVDELSKLKMKIGKMVAEADNIYLQKDQEYKIHEILRSQELYESIGSYDRAKDRAKVELQKEKLEVIQSEGKCETLKNYYKDLNDVLVSVRQSANRFDLSNSNQQ